MSRVEVVGPLIAAVLVEAKKEFGPPAAWDRAVVTRWVQARVRQLRGEPVRPAHQADLWTRDGRMAAVGGDE